MCHRPVIRAQHYSAQRGRTFVLRRGGHPADGRDREQKNRQKYKYASHLLDLYCVHHWEYPERIRVSPSAKAIPAFKLEFRATQASAIVMREKCASPPTCQIVQGICSGIRTNCRSLGISQSCIRFRFYEILGLQTTLRRSNATFPHPPHIRLPHQTRRRCACPG